MATEYAARGEYTFAAGPVGPEPIARRRPHGRSAALPVVIWSICLYVLLQVPLFLIKDRWQSIGPLNETRKWPRLRQIVKSEPNRPLALMLGSSRVTWAFRAGQLNDVPAPDGKIYKFYNFGIPATGVIHSLLYVRDMLAEGIHPKLLLVEYLPPLLCEPHGTWGSEELFASMAWTSRRDLLRLNHYFSRHGHQKIREWITSRIAPWYMFRDQIKDEIKECLTGIAPEQPPEIDEWGACIVPPRSDDAKRAEHLEETLKMYRSSLAHYRLGTGPSRAFRELLELCRQQNIRVVLVIMPESSTFRSLYFDKARSESQVFLQQLVSTYHPDVIDANEWLEDDDFEDGHHVVPSGADSFTARLHAVLLHMTSPKPDPVERESPRYPKNGILENGGACRSDFPPHRS